MQTIIEGVVEKTSVQDSPAGAKRAWKKKGLFVNGKWYNVFLNKDNEVSLANAVDGTSVKIVTEQKGEYENVVSVAVLSTAAAKASPQVAKSVAAIGEKDFRITYLASRRDALEFVTRLLPLDVLALPTKKSDKVDAIYGYVKEFADRFAADAMTATLKTKDNETDDSNSTDSDLE